MGPLHTDYSGVSSESLNNRHQHATLFDEKFMEKESDGWRMGFNVIGIRMVAILSVTLNPGG